MARVVAFTVLVVLVCAAALMAANAQSPTRETHGRPTDKGPQATSDDDPSNDRPEPRRQAGRLSVDGNHVEGRFVEFSFDLSTCRVSTFQAYNTTLFPDIHLPGTDCRIAPGGPIGRFEMRGSDVGIRLHDSPNALIQFQADEPVELVWASNLNVNISDGGVELSIGNLTGRLFSKNDTDISTDGGVARAMDGSFMLHPPSGTSEERREIFDAIQQGKVGAESDILLDNGTIVSETLTYDDVQVKVKKTRDDRFDFTVGGNLSQGRVFITNFDPGAWSPERLRVDYADVDDDGRTHGVMIRQADTLENVLDFDPGKGPVYFVFEDEMGWHAAVAVPEFSVHLFQVVGLPLQVVPLLLYGIVIGGLFFAAGGLGILLERRARG
ncbi:MAG TPA: hypothetical protein VGB18_07255 [Candidatus Thermoplasmatota archaeon]